MIIILIPAYNEAKALPGFFNHLRDFFSQHPFSYQLILCNDGSTDDTAAIAQEYQNLLPMEIIHHKINRGLGETVRDLFERAVEIGKPGDVVIRMEGDDTNDPIYILKMLKKIAEGVDVVSASRFEMGGGQTGLNKKRQFISRGANLFMKLFFPIKGLREYSCGFRAYRFEILQRAVHFYKNNFIQLTGLGFTCTLEKLLKLKILGATFTEIPFTLKYDQKLSDSKMVFSLTTMGYIIMTILYYWPWGGWRTGYKKRLRKLTQLDPAHPPV